MKRISHQIIPLLLVSFMLSLFSLPVFAFDDFGPYLIQGNRNFLTDAQQNFFCSNSSTILDYNYILYDTSNSELWYGTITKGPYEGNWNYYWSERHVIDSSGRHTQDSGWFTYNDNIATYRFSWGSVSRPDTTNVLLNGCSVSPTPTPDTPVVSVSCPVYLNDVLSNDYISSLLTWLYRGNVEQFIIYRVQQTYDISNFPSTTQIDQIGEFKGYVLTTPTNQVQTFVYEYNRPMVITTDQGNMHYSYMDILDPDFTDDWEMVLHWSCLDTRFESPYDAQEQINSSIQQTIVQNSQIIASQNQTNNLIDSGNSASQNASSSIDSVTSDLNTSSGKFEQFEAQFNQDLSSNLELIDISGGNLGNVSDFVSTANFVKLQFDTILNNSGLYKAAITFSLILGLALLLIGRRS